MTGLQTGRQGQDFGYQAVQTIVERFTSATALTTVVNDAKKKIPAYAHLLPGSGVHIVTAFNDTGTDTLDVGFRLGSSTDDDNAYATLLDLSAVGYIVLDELATTTNIVQTKDTILTYRYNGQNANASAGEAYLVINYVVGGP